MAVKRFKPITPGTRQKTVSSFAEVTTDKPEKSLLVSKNKTGGRNNYGRITVRHIGGGNRNKYRIIDFKRNKDNIPAKVATIEYDPNRTSYIALLHYADGEKRYILAPLGLNVGDTVLSGENADIKAGNNTAETVIPSLMVAGDYTSGIYIYNGRVYYATPNTVGNTQGEVDNTVLSFRSANLNGSDVQEHLRVAVRTTWPGAKRG